MFFNRSLGRHWPIARAFPRTDQRTFGVERQENLNHHLSFGSIFGPWISRPLSQSLHEKPPDDQYEFEACCAVNDHERRLLNKGGPSEIVNCLAQDVVKDPIGEPHWCGLLPVNGARVKVHVVIQWVELQRRYARLKVLSTQFFDAPREDCRICFELPNCIVAALGL